MSAPRDCRCCGACCFSAAEQFVAVTGADWARLGAEATQLAHFVGIRAFMNMHDGHCIALRVGRDPHGAPDFFCTIYEQRPQVCRELERGSPQCDGERGKPVAIAAAGANLFAPPAGTRGVDAAHANFTSPGGHADHPHT